MSGAPPETVPDGDPKSSSVNAKLFLTEHQKAVATIPCAFLMLVLANWGVADVYITAILLLFTVVLYFLLSKVKKSLLAFLLTLTCLICLANKPLVQYLSSSKRQDDLHKQTLREMSQLSTGGTQVGESIESDNPPKNSPGDPIASYNNPDSPKFTTPCLDPINPNQNSLTINFHDNPGAWRIDAATPRLIIGSGKNTKSIELPDSDYKINDNSLSIQPGRGVGVFGLDLSVRFVDGAGTFHSASYNIGSHFYRVGQELCSFLRPSNFVSITGDRKFSSEGLELCGHQDYSELSLLHQVRTPRPYSEVLDIKVKCLPKDESNAMVDETLPDGFVISLRNCGRGSSGHLGEFDKQGNIFKIFLNGSLKGEHLLRVTYDSDHTRRIEFMDSGEIVDLGHQVETEWTSIASVYASHCDCQILGLGFGTFEETNLDTDHTLVLGQPCTSNLQ